MYSLNELQSALNEGQIIERLIVPPELSIESIIDNRESATFSSKWMESYSSIESQKASMDPQLVEQVTAVREAAYVRAYARWKSPDLAAYISDDFGLIGDAIVLNINDSWVERLLGTYLGGAIPHLHE